MSRSRAARELLRVMPRRGAKANEMSARPRQRFYTCGGILLLLASSGACDDGLVQLRPLPAAGDSPDAGFLSGGGGSGGGSAAGPGSFGDPRAGSGGGPRPPPPNPCDEGSAQEQEREQELREALTEAFGSGRYCPNLASGQRRQLVLDRDLEWRARATICVTFSSLNWFQVPRTPVMGWVLLDTPSLEDAKKALLGGDHTELCEEAERTQFRFIGVGHLYDVWTVFVSPGASEEMQKP